MPPHSSARMVASGAMMSTAAGAGHGAREHVAAQVVGAEPVRAAGRLQDGEGVRQRRSLRERAVEKTPMTIQKSTMSAADHERGAAQQRLDEVATLTALLGGGGSVVCKPATLVGGSASRDGSLRPVGGRGHLSPPCGCAG